MALWAVFIFAGLALLHLKTRAKLAPALLLSAVSGIYFIIVVAWIIPSLANEGRAYLHFNYNALGSNFGEALTTIITKPLYCLRLLFVNHTEVPEAYGIKQELHFMVLFSGGLVLLLRPQYLVMLIPVYAQKLFNNDYGKWGINYQYSIEFVPVLTAAVFTWIGGLRISPKKARHIAISATILTFATTLKVLDSRISKWYGPENVRFYQARHYKRDFDVKAVHKTLEMIPNTAAVSAQSPLVPHLAFRDYIYQFPVIGRAEYIVLNPMEDPYPLIREQYDLKVKQLSDSTGWVRLKAGAPLIIFKRSNR